MLGNMRVNFGGFDAAVSQQLLDDANVGAGFLQMRGVAVPEHVQGNRSTNTGGCGGLFCYRAEGCGSCTLLLAVSLQR